MSDFRRSRGWSARTHERVDVPLDGMYDCPECKKEVKLFQKMFCWLCSECRIVLINA